MSKSTWAVRDYREGDEVQILKLFKKVFERDRSLLHWRWKFQQNPAGKQITLAVTDDGTLVGHFGGLPNIATTPTKTFLMTQGIDHMVDPEWQGQGIYRAMARHFFETFMHNGSIAGWFSFPDQSRFEIQGKAFGPRAFQEVPILSWSLANSESWGSSTPDLKQYHIECVDGADTSVDELWDLCRSELILATRRDSLYLNWRYAKCPDVKYTFVIARSRGSERPLGLAVVRFGWFDQPIAPIVDWLVPGHDLDVARALVASCHDLAQERKQAAMQVSFPSYAPQYSFFVSLGYKAGPSRCLPSVLWPDNSEIAEPMKRGWYYTMGDSDMY